MTFKDIRDELKALEAILVILDGLPPVARQTVLVRLSREVDARPAAQMTAVALAQEAFRRVPPTEKAYMARPKDRRSLVVEGFRLTARGGRYRRFQVITPDQTQHDYDTYDQACAGLLRLLVEHYGGTRQPELVSI